MADYAVAAESQADSVGDVGAGVGTVPTYKGRPAPNAENSLRADARCSEESDVSQGRQHCLCSARCDKCMHSGPETYLGAQLERLFLQDERKFQSILRRVLDDSNVSAIMPGKIRYAGRIDLR